MLLRDLPPKISEHVRRSVTWADVETAALGRERLRRALARVTHRGWSALNFRAAVIRRRKGASRHKGSAARLAHKQP